MGNSDPSDVGPGIRAIREELGLSLREVSARAGLSVNAISRIERGDNSPTVASLHLIAEALGVSITEFFVKQAEQTVIYLHPADRSASEYATMQIESLGSGLRNQQLEPFMITVLPGHAVDTKPITHAGQEFVYCLEGKLCYRVGDEAFKLEPGCSLLFDAAQPHYFWNNSSEVARLIFVFQAASGHPMKRHTSMP